MFLKPITLCLVQMGNKGLELVTAYPKVLPKKVLDELTYKSMPMSAKPGDFSSGSIGDLFYSSFIFQLPREDVRHNIGAIIAVFEDMKYNLEGVKKTFSCIIKELDGKSLLKLDIIQEILPNLYTGFVKGAINIKISSVATISIKFNDMESSEEEKDYTEDLEEDLWR